MTVRTPELQRDDPALYAILEKETQRQRQTLEMIASESVQDAVSLSLGGSVFAQKTAVGLPGHQRLGGAEQADALEKLAAARACSLFGAQHANILPYSGTTANLCVYQALLQPGDAVLSLDPEQGGHASHGREGHLSASLYRFFHFGVRQDDQRIDYEQMERMLEECRPRLVVVGTSSYPREIDWRRIAAAAHRAGALLLVDMAHTSGLVAAGAAENPVPWADVVTASATKTMCGCHTGYILCRKELADAIDRGVYPGVVASMHLQTVAAAAWAFRRAATPEFAALMRQTVQNAKALCAALQKEGFALLTGGTDCHLLVADLRPTGPDAPEFVRRLAECGISANTKRIPFDPSESPRGVRAGCTVLTQRGMKEAEMEKIAAVWGMARRGQTAAGAALVRQLVGQFPLP